MLNQFLPENYAEGNRIPDGRSVIIVGAEAKQAEYTGAAQGLLASCVLVTAKDLANNTEYQEQLTCGKWEKVQPSPDGKSFINPETGEPATLQAGSNLAVFLKSAFERQAPRAIVTDPNDPSAPDIRSLVGLSFGVQRIKGETFSRPDDKPDAKKADRTILGVGKFIGYDPAQAAKVKAQGAQAQGNGQAPAPVAQASSTPAVASGNGGTSMEDLAAGAIVMMLSANKDKDDNLLPITKGQLVGKFTAFANAADTDAMYKGTNRVAITQLLMKPSFLKSREEFAFDEKSVSLPA